MKKKRVVTSSDDDSDRTVRPVNLRRISESDDDSSDGYQRILENGDQRLSVCKNGARPRDPHTWTDDDSDDSSDDDFVPTGPRPKIRAATPGLDDDELWAPPPAPFTIPAPGRRSSVARFFDDSAAGPRDDSDDDDEDYMPAVDEVATRSQVEGMDLAAGPRVKARGWCITINNYTDDDQQRLRDFYATEDGCKYLIFGKEIAPTTGTPHLQCYLHLDNPRYGNVLRACIGHRGNWKVANGTPAQNKKYCSKDHDFFEFGEVPQQGKRNDLVTLVRRVCTEGATMQSLIDGGEHDVLATYCRNERSISKLATMVSGKRDASQAPTVHWLYGETGTGKSRWAFETYPDAYRFPCDGSGWWDGYTGQKVVVFDDLRANSGLSFSVLLKVLDRYPMRVQQKGASTELLATTFVITAPAHPEVIFGACGEKVDQLLRRISIPDPDHTEDECLRPRVSGIRRLGPEPGFPAIVLRN